MNLKRIRVRMPKWQAISGNKMELRDEEGAVYLIRSDKP